MLVSLFRVGVGRLLRGVVRNASVAVRFYASEGSMRVVVPEGAGTEQNIRSETNRLSKTMTRFWDKAETKIDRGAGTVTVTLDGKPLRTPLGFELAVPEKKAHLAHLVAHEWGLLTGLQIKANTLPMTSLVSRAIDLTRIHQEDTRDEDLIAKVGRLEDIKLNMLNYLDTDTCLVFTTHEEYDGALRKRQEELYRPLIAEFENYFTVYGCENGLLAAEDEIKLNFLDCETDGLRGNSQSPLTQSVVLHWLDRLPIFDLVALEKGLLTCKSFLCGAALVRSNATAPEFQKLYQLNHREGEKLFSRTVPELVELGNLELIFQTGEWGEVEDTHDVDSQEWVRNLTSAALVCY